MNVTTYRLITGDARAELGKLDAESVQTCVTSPPYWGLRDYGMADQIGLESTPAAYVDQLVEVFREVRRVLRPDGTLWLNLGDCYAEAGSGEAGERSTLNGARHAHNQVRRAIEASGRKYRPAPEGMKPKDLVGIPWTVAFALRADGWYLRSEVIWHKPNGMPESVRDRPTRAHETLFLLSKSERYFYDQAAIAEPVAEATAERYAYGFNDRYADAPDAKGYRGRFHGTEKPPAPTTRNKRTVWTINTRPLAEAHFAPFPEELVHPCILAGSSAGSTVIDPFNGAGTTGVVAARTGRHYIGIDLNPEYVAISRDRISAVAPLLVRPY